MTDPLTLRLVLAFAGLTVLAAMVGGIALAYTDRTLPDALIALGSGALGLLGGAAIPTGRQEVVIRQPVNEPVPVTTDDGAGELRNILVIAAGLCLGLVLYYLVVLPLTR